MACESGQTFQIFKRSLTPFLWDLGMKLDNYSEEGGRNSCAPNRLDNKKLTTKNLELIYRTFGSFYYGVQRFAAMTENSRSRPYWEYDVVVDRNTSALCKTLVDKVFLFDSPFWEKFYPPNHPACRAFIRAFTKEELDGRNLTICDGSGIIHPHPRWAFNPGRTNWKAFFDNLVIKTLGL